MPPRAVDDVVFKAFPQFERPELKKLARLKRRMNAVAATAFDRDVPADRIARALADRQSIHVKELLESFEFHHRVRRRMRAAHMADLCCGHGLTGILLAIEDRVQTVTLLDRRKPEAHEAVLAGVAEVYPQVRDKVRYIEADITEAPEHLRPGTGCVAVHACGAFTDRCIDAALAVQGTIAVMPCCYESAGHPGPTVLRKELGKGLAVDIHRSYRLDKAGLKVDWAGIPEAITPMNRIVIGWR